MAPLLAGPRLVVGVQQVILHIRTHAVGQSLARQLPPSLVEIGMKAEWVGNLDQLGNYIGQKRKLLGTDQAVLGHNNRGRQQGSSKRIVHKQTGRLSRYLRY